ERTRASVAFSYELYGNCWFQPYSAAAWRLRQTKGHAMSTDLKVTKNPANDTSDSLTPQADLAIAQTNSGVAPSYQVAATNPFPSLQFGARIVSSDFNSDGNLDILYQ